MVDIINLYVAKNSTCPKCKILLEQCKKSQKIKNSDFEIIEIDTSNKEDANLNLLIENNILLFPVLLVNNTFMTFEEAMKYVRE